MAITTIDQLLAGYLPPEPVIKQSYVGEAAGQYASTFYVVGRPGAAAAPSPGLNGAALTSYAGQIPFPAAVGGKNIYLGALDVSGASGIGAAILCDRLWHNSGIVVATTTAQAITSGAMPARDTNGATLGDGLLAALEVSAATTNAGAISTITLNYTNSAGVAGRTGTMPAFPATAAAGTFVPFALQAGDTGIRSIEGITLGTSLVTGTVHLVVYRQIAIVGTPVSNVSAAKGPLELGLPRMYDSSVPFLLHVLGASAVGTTAAMVTYAQG